MKSLTDWIARNRRWIGGVGLALWTAAQGDQALVTSHPRVMMYAGALAAYVMASGIHKPDESQRLKQAVEKLDEPVI